MASRQTRRGLRPFFHISTAALVLTAACNRGEGAAPDNNSPNRAAGAGQSGPSGQPGGAPGQGPGPGRAGGPIPIEVATVHRGSVAREATVAGVLAPLRTVGVNAQMGGALLSVRVEEGDVVREGQVLAEIDSRELRAQVRSAEATLALARSTAERSATLFKDRVVTAAENERDQANYEAAKATLDALKTRLGFAAVKASASGVITEKRAEAGDVVGSQSRLFTIADVSTLLVRVQVSELDVAGLRVGQPAAVTVDAVGGASFSGTLRRIFPAADSVSRMVPVEVALAGTAVRQLRPGYLARVTFKLGERPGVLLAPSRAVVGARDARAVYLKKGERVERRAVRVGQSSGDVVEILEGLAEGDTVVTAGTEQLRDGVEVRVVPPVGTPTSTKAAPAGSTKR